MPQHDDAYDPLTDPMAGLPVPAATPARGGLSWPALEAQIRAGEAARTDPAREFLIGVLGAAQNRLLHPASNLLRQAMGQPPATPAVIPQTAAGQAGRVAEQIAEYAPALGTARWLLRGAPTALRAAGQGVAGGTLAASQTEGDPVATMTTGLLTATTPLMAPLSRAARAATGGGIGAAVGSAQSGGDPIATVAGTALGATAGISTSRRPPPDPVVSWRQAFGTPRGKAPEIRAAVPMLAEAERLYGRRIDSLEDLAEALRTAKQANRAIYQQLGGGPARRAITTVDLRPVGAARLEAMPPLMRLENPRAVQRAVQDVARYDREVPLDDAESMLVTTNAIIDQLEQLPATGRFAATQKHYTIAAYAAQARALRQSIFATLDRMGDGPAQQALQRRYGQLLDLERDVVRALNRRGPMGGQPTTFDEVMQRGAGTADLLTGVQRLASLNPMGMVHLWRARRAMGQTTEVDARVDREIRRVMAGARRLPAPAPIGPTPPPPPVALLPSHAGPSQVPALPPGRGPITPLPASVISTVRSQPARRTVQRDPRTGRMRRVYTGEPE